MSPLAFILLLLRCRLCLNLLRHLHHSFPPYQDIVSRLSITHFIGGPCESHDIHCCLLPGSEIAPSPPSLSSPAAAGGGGGGAAAVECSRGWSVIDDADTAISIACSRWQHTGTCETAALKKTIQDVTRLCGWREYCGGVKRGADRPAAARRTQRRSWRCSVVHWRQVAAAPSRLDVAAAVAVCCIACLAIIELVAAFNFDCALTRLMTDGMCACAMAMENASVPIASRLFKQQQA